VSVFNQFIEETIGRINLKNSQYSVCYFTFQWGNKWGDDYFM